MSSRRSRRTLTTAAACVASALTVLTLGLTALPASASTPRPINEDGSRIAITLESPYDTLFQQLRLERLATPSIGASQEFVFIPEGLETYQIESAASGECLMPDLRGAGGVGTPIIQVPFCGLKGLPQLDWHFQLNHLTTISNDLTHECLRDVATHLVQSWCPASLATAPTTEIWGPGGIVAID